MKFEYDKIKSSINKSKHNIDFKEAQKLWEDPYSFEIPSSQSEDEERFLVLGQINSKNYTAIITYDNALKNPDNFLTEFISTSLSV